MKTLTSDEIRAHAGGGDEAAFEDCYRGFMGGTTPDVVRTILHDEVTIQRTVRALLTNLTGPRWNEEDPVISDPDDFCRRITKLLVLTFRDK